MISSNWTVLHLAVHALCLQEGEHVDNAGGLCRTNIDEVVRLNPIQQTHWFRSDRLPERREVRQIGLVGAHALRIVQFEDLAVETGRQRRDRGESIRWRQLEPEGRRRHANPKRFRLPGAALTGGPVHADLGPKARAELVLFNVEIVAAL